MKALTLLLAIIILFIASPGVSAQDTLVVATDYWPPFRIKGAEGITGIDIDLMQIIGKRMGVRVQFHREPWARCLLDMEKGSADLMTGLARTPERERYISYLSPSYYECAPAFYERAGRGGQPIKTYEDLRDVTIGFTRGSAYFEPFDSDTKLTKIPITNEDQLLKMLTEGRLDVIIGTDCQVDYDLTKNNLGKSVRKTPFKPGKSIALFIGMSKLSRFRERAGEIESILRELMEEGTIEAIARKYLGVEAKPE